jgi:DNA-binding FrmR family transcriptional regulator
MPEEFPPQLVAIAAVRGVGEEALLQVVEQHLEEILGEWGAQPG